MCEKRYLVKLTREEREHLEERIRKGESPAKRQLKARILLKSDEAEGGPGWNDSQISEAFETYPLMAYRVRQQFVEAGLEAVLSRKKREKPAIERVFDGEKEARLIPLAGSEAPKGRAGWTLRLLAEEAVELELVAHASHSTVGRTLKKTHLSRTSNNNGSFRHKPAAPA